MNILSEINNLNNLNSPSIIDLIIENIQNKQVLGLCTSKMPTLTADLSNKDNSYHALLKSEGVEEEKSHIVIPDLEKIKQIIRVEEQLKLKQKELHMLNHKIKNRRFLSSHYNNNSPNSSSPSPNTSSPTIVININNTPSQNDDLSMNIAHPTAIGVYLDGLVSFYDGY